MQCCVCYEPTRSGLGCNHALCNTCLPHVKRLNGKCPLCMRPMQPRNHPLSFKSCLTMVADGNLGGLQLLFDTNDIRAFQRTPYLKGVARANGHTHVLHWLNE